MSGVSIKFEKFIYIVQSTSCVFFEKHEDMKIYEE